MNLTIGSGDISALLMDKKTKGFQDLIRKFVSENAPYYNAIASPIDACRTGAILEDRYLQILPNDYFTQYKVTCSEMDVFTSSLDFALINGGKLIDFDELKTLSLNDYIEIISPLSDDYIHVIKKTFAKYYNQVQCQLMCSGLESANLVFLAVESYDDEINYSRSIKDSEYRKFRIYRDDLVIEKIKERGILFQNIKNYINGTN